MIKRKSDKRLCFRIFKREMYISLSSLPASVKKKVYYGECKGREKRGDEGYRKRGRNEGNDRIFFSRKEICRAQRG